MKKALLMVTTMMMVLILAGTASASTDIKSIQLVIGENQAKVDSKNVTMSAPAEIINGSTMVPLRFVGEAFGCDVQWNGPSNTAVVKLADQTIAVPIGASYAVINGTKINVAVPAQLINGSTYVPLRFISENLGAKIDYNSSTHAVSIIFKTYTNKALGVQMVQPTGWEVREQTSGAATFALNQYCRAEIGLADKGEGVDSSKFNLFAQGRFAAFKDKDIVTTQSAGVTALIIYREGDNLVAEYLKLLDGEIYYADFTVAEISVNASIRSQFELMINTMESPAN